MSETNGFQVPAEQEFDTVGLQGSMQEILQDNIGSYVTVDFLIGTQNMVSKDGLLYSVGTQFIVLYEDVSKEYIVCDIFAIKFVTFYLPGYRPGQVPSETTPATETSAPVQTETAPTAAQAAYAHVLKKTRR